RRRPDRLHLQRARPPLLRRLCPPARRRAAAGPPARWDERGGRLEPRRRLAAALADERALLRQRPLPARPRQRGRAAAHRAQRRVAGLPDGVIAGLKLSADGSLLVFTLYAPTRNGNVWAVDTATGEAWQVTSASQAGIPAAALAEPRLVRYPAFDGLEIPALL